MHLDKKAYNLYLVTVVITGMLLFMVVSLIYVVNSVSSGSSAEMAKKERAKMR